MCDTPRPLFRSSIHLHALHDDDDAAPLRDGQKQDGDRIHDGGQAPDIPRHEL